jgi:hypothetical protein
MKRFVLNVLAVGALLGAAIASQAQTLTYELITGDTPWTTPNGVVGVGTGGPAGSTYDPAITNLFQSTAMNPIQLGTPTVLNYGVDFTLPGMGSASTFTNFVATPVDFNFRLTGTSGPTDMFHAAGTIDGVVGYRADGSVFSNAAVTFSSLTDSFGNVGALTTDPNNGLPAIGIVSVIGGIQTNTWLDVRFSKPNPGDSFIPQGFLTTTSPVPEPGTITLLASSCITGSVFLLRRFRRA